VLVQAAAGCAAGPAPTVVPASVLAQASSWDVTAMADPCRVVTVTEVRAVLGSGVGTGTRLQSWPPVCRFVLDESRQTYVYLSDDSRPGAVDDFAGHRSRTGQVVTVAALGDQAYWLPDVTTLHVLHGPTELVVTFRGAATPADAQTRAARLAALALPRTTPG